MNSFFFILMILAMFAALAAVFSGIFISARGGEVNQKYGNTLMRARIILQGVAIGCFALAIMAGKDN